MQKIKFTKGELKRQRDALKQFQHFLPVLQLKKQQLQLEISRIHEKLKLKVKEAADLKSEISQWAGLFNEGTDYIAPWVKPKEVITDSFNIAGIDIPVFKNAVFEKPVYDLFLTPLWIDRAIEKIKDFAVKIEEEKIFKKQSDILERELRITTQRVNLFEKVKIPECKENIRLVRIYLGDQQVNAVGRSKIAKKKLEEIEEVLESVSA